MSEAIDYQLTINTWVSLAENNKGITETQPIQSRLPNDELNKWFLF